MPQRPPLPPADDDEDDDPAPLAEWWDLGSDVWFEGA